MNATAFDQNTPSLPNLAHIKALVVDDDEFQNELTAELLRQLGLVDVTTVSDPEQALRALNSGESEYGLVLMDLCMPGIDGFQFIESVARARFTGALIIISGQSKQVIDAATLIAQWRHLKLLGTLIKPVERGALAKLLSGLEQERDETALPPNDLRSLLSKISMDDF